MSAEEWLVKNNIKLEEILAVLENHSAKLDTIGIRQGEALDAPCANCYALQDRIDDLEGEVSIVQDRYDAVVAQYKRAKASGDYPDLGEDEV